MARRATGQVIEKSTARGVVFALRFRACGRRQYVTLGTAAEGWTRKRADAELTVMLAQVELGTWQPAQSAPTAAPTPVIVPTFHEFASEWFAQHARGWEPHTAKTYKGLLANHLLPFFHEHTLAQITVGEVDRYRDDRLTEADRRDKRRAGALRHNDENPTEPEPVPARLSATTINKTLVLLGSILAVAEERELVARNPLRVNPSRRKAKRDRRRPVYLDSAEHIAALMQAAGELDGEPDALTSGRRALIATLVFGGLRLGEACALDWRDVNLADGWLYVGSKTDAGMRDVRILPALRDELLAHKAAATAGDLDDPVFVTASGQRRRVDNARQRVMQPVLVRAEAILATTGAQPLPEGVTAHKLRHTAASILAALNTPMPEVIAQLGHTDPGFTLRVYAHTMRRDDRELERLRALVEGRDWAPMGTGARSEDVDATADEAPLDAENPAGAGLSWEAADGTRTHDLLHGKKGKNPANPLNKPNRDA